MNNSHYTSNGVSFKMDIFPPQADGKKYPVIIVLHGNAGLVAPFGDQIRGFAKDIADLGYLTAVPHYYPDNESHLFDTVPHNQELADAIANLAARPDADSTRIGLVGFSLGATTAMTYLAISPQASNVKVLADFYGFITPTIESNAASFPPTIIQHNKNDKIVIVSNSERLYSLLPPGTARFIEYNSHWQEVNHAFEPNGTDDIASRNEAIAWFSAHLPPIGQ